MAFIYGFQWHRTLFAPAIRLYLCMSQDSICSGKVNGLHNWVFFKVMFQTYFKIVVLLITIHFHTTSQFRIPTFALRICEVLPNEYQCTSSKKSRTEIFWRGNLFALIKRKQLQKSNNSSTFSSFVRTIDRISDMSLLISSSTAFLNKLYLISLFMDFLFWGGGGGEF